MAINIPVTPPAPSFGELFSRYRDEMAALDAATEQADIDWLADASFSTLEELSATPALGVTELADKLQLVVDRFADFDPPNMRFVRDALDDARRLSSNPVSIMPWTSNVDHRLFAAIEAHDATSAEMRVSTGDPDWDQHVDRGYAIYQQVFDLPNTFANLRTRARAIASIVNDDGDVANLSLPELAAHGEGVCGELVRQVLVCIMAPTCLAVPQARDLNDDGQFVLPPIPAGVTPALAAAIDVYRTQFVTDETADAWHAAAMAIHAHQPASVADLAAKLIIAIHYRDPEIADGRLATEAPSAPADRLGVEMQLACLDALRSPGAWAEGSSFTRLRAEREAAQIAEESYYTANTPLSGGWPPEVEAEGERLADIRRAIDDRLMDSPSPDATAFAYKYLVAHGNGRETDCWNAIMEREAQSLAGPTVIPMLERWEQVYLRYHQNHAPDDAAVARADGGEHAAKLDERNRLSARMNDASEGENTDADYARLGELERYVLDTPANTPGEAISKLRLIATLCHEGSSLGGERAEEIVAECMAVMS